MPKRTWLLLLTVVTVVLLVAFFAPWREEVAEPDRPDAEPAPPAAEPPPATPPAAPPPEPGSEAPAAEEAPPPVLLFGRVVLGDGSPAEGATVTAGWSGAALRAGAVPARYGLTGKTDEQGRYELRATEAIQRLPVWLRVTAVRDGRFAICDAIERPEPPFEAPDLILEDVLRIQGRVIDSTGAPVAGVHAGIFHARDGLEEYGDLAATSDRDGRLVFHPITRKKDWSLSLKITCPGYPETEMDLSTADALAGKPFGVVLPAGIEIRGIVVTPDGEPVAGVQIVVAKKQSGAPKAEYQSRVVTGKDGKFVLKGAPAEGAAPLLYAGLSKPLDFFSAQRVLPMRLPMVTGRNGQVIDLGAIVLDPPGEIRGRVLDPEGAPLKGATVSISVDVLGAGGVSTQSAADGSFVLKGIPTGRFAVEARKSFREIGTLEGRTEDVGAGDSGVVVQVKRGRAILLRFHVDGDPAQPHLVTGYSVSFNPHPPPPPGKVLISGGGSSTRSTGRRALWRVKKEPGTYRLSVTPVGCETVDCGVVTVHEDEDAEIRVPCRPK